MISLKIMLPLAVVILIVVFLASMSLMTRHDRIKPEGQRILSDCPDSPNCVSSQASDESHKIPAFELLDNNPQLSWDRFIQAVDSAGGEILGWDEEEFVARLRMKPVRTASGVAPVTLLTRPYPCPGECIFCPWDVRMPKSYLSNEPGAMRALMLSPRPVRLPSVLVEKKGLRTFSMMSAAMPVPWSRNEMRTCGRRLTLSVSVLISRSLS